MYPINAALLVLAGENPALRNLAREATGLAFPQANLIQIDSVSEARQIPKLGNEILLLAEPKARDVAQALETPDSSGLARWPVIVLGSALAPIEGVVIVHPDKSSLERSVQTLLDAATAHQLRQENARLRGDLLTVGNRLCHDLRALLGGISSATELIKEVLAEEKPALTNLTEPIFHSSDEMVKVIRRVSFLIKATVNPPAMSTLEMAGIVLAALERLESDVTHKCATVSQPTTWPRVVGVASWVETIWWNLVANALQNGGETPRIHLGWDSFPGGNRFWVRDHGPGIGVENQGTLFQPFHHLHESTVRNGIGLSVVQRLVNLQGGDCGYAPGSGGGSCFYFTLPGDTALKFR